MPEDNEKGIFGRIGGFLSSYAEWHAMGIGATFGLIQAVTGRPEVGLIFLGIIMGVEKKRRGHLRDAWQEIAYSGAAFVIVFFAASFVLGTSIVMP